MRKVLLSSLLFAGVFATAQTNQDAAKFTKTITGKDLKEKLTIVAGPEMEGRETATEGQRKAAAYIENQFKKLGLLPGAGAGYQQYYPVYQDELYDKSLIVNGKTFTYDKDYNYALQASAGGIFVVTDFVFVGYGMQDNAAKINDYATIDVKGKVVMVIDGAIDGYKAPVAANGARVASPSSAASKITLAKSKGAVGFILISKDFPKKTPSIVKGNMYLKKNDASNIVVASVSEEVASAMLGRTATLSSNDIKEISKGLYISENVMQIGKVTNELQSSNVVGLLEGTDKKEEYLVLTAHYDHLGKRDTVIYYGADDDGSGTVSVIEMAEAFVAAKQKGKGPRRSVVFMTVSGEEKGLWGSQFYSENPLFPIAKTTANLNTDMVGRTDPKYKGDTSNYVYIIGDDKLSSDLAPLTDSINKTAQMELDRRYNDISDPNRFYYRSDHYNFAKVGVPIIFYFDGVHADYHRPSDTVDKINFALMEKRVKLIFNTAWTIANKDQMLKRDIPLNIPPR